MYSKNEEEIFKILNSNIDGLDSKEAEKRLKDYGQNIILNKKKKIWILRFLKQLIYIKNLCFLSIWSP
ncbi:MAG: cation-transporting P-type ATPase [Bacilli bacterium]|nr:cation-transporting P-type ATPase [Bacilli bacterium]